MLGVTHYILGGVLGVFFTLGLSSHVNAQDLRLTPPKIDYASCIAPRAPLDDLAEKLKSSSISNSGIRDENLISLADLFKNGSGKTIPDISKTIEIVEYLISKKNIKLLLKARALKIKAQLMYAGEGYTENTAEAKKILQKVIKNTDPTATLNLAKMLEVEGKFSEAEAMYKKSLEYKDPVAALALAYMYHNKDIIVPQTTTDSYVILAQNMLLEKLASGQCDYFGKIGFMYMNLRGLADNEKLAAEWLLPASQFNHARSKQQLAALIAKGYLSDVINKPSEKILLQQAAELGSADAMYDLGMSLLGQDDTKTDAITWLKKSGERQNIQAIERLIKYYRSLSDNQDDYIKWLDMASKNDEIDPEYLIEYADALKSQKSPNQKKVFSLYEQAGRLGNDEALFEMGESYKHGIGVDKNATKALRFYRLAAEKANLDAYESMVDAYECGVGKNPDTVIAAKWKARGEYYGLSSIYNKIDGEFQNADDKTAFIKTYIPQIKLIARDKKSVRAMVWLGVMYEFLGDDTQSKKWLDRSFSMKNKDEAMYHYARELQDGFIIPTDIEKSNQFMKQAADNNNTSALKRLGQNFEKSGDYMRARDMFKKSYELGDYKSAIKVADMERELGNEDKAIAYLKKAASYNNADAMFELAKIHNDKNPEIAKKWFDGVQQNYICDTGDILEIAESYIDGKNGASKDIKKADEWLARIPNMDGLSDNDQLDYASLILNSTSFKNRPEYKMALKNLESMATNNNPKASAFIADYYLNVVQNPEKAIYWLTQSANAADSDAMVQLGKLYLSGYMVEQSNVTAMEWFQKSVANDNNPDAIQYLETLQK